MFPALRCTSNTTAATTVQRIISNSSCCVLRDRRQLLVSRGLIHPNKSLVRCCGAGGPCYCSRLAITESLLRQYQQQQQQLQQLVVNGDQQRTSARFSSSKAGSTAMDVSDVKQEAVGGKKRPLEEEEEEETEDGRAAAAPSKDKNNGEESQTNSDENGTKKKKSGWKNKRDKLKKKKQQKQSKNDEGNPDEPQEDRWSKPGATIHEGSFAHDQMRQLFRVSLPEQPPLDPTVKTTKKKIAVLLGYLGTNYSGFQMNRGQRTLQAEFELAAYRAGLITDRNFGFPHKCSWSTSGRTDKGVHAAAQVVSFKAELLPETGTTNQKTTVRESLNAHLPSDVRVLDVARTTKAFCAKTQRDRVRYQYMIPSFCLYPVEQLRELFEKVGAVGEDGSAEEKNDNDDDDDNNNNNNDDDDDDSDNWNGRIFISPDAVAKMQPVLATYRVTPPQLKALKDCLALYQGTHSFHNFARRVCSSEARANRFIESFVTEDPVVVNGVEWIPTQVTGQSFMLNQIRKMICLAVDVARGAATPEFLRYALRTGKALNIANAPAQGLYLDMSIYHFYNSRGREASTAADLDELNWHVPGTPANGRWKDFRNSVVMAHVVSEEAAQGNFVAHLWLQEYAYRYRKQYVLPGGETSTTTSSRTITAVNNNNNITDNAKPAASTISKTSASTKDEAETQ